MTYYKKVGRKYIPVKESEDWCGWPEGDYLVSIRPSHTSIQQCLQPEFANVEAALTLAAEAMTKAMGKQLMGRPGFRLVSHEEQCAWEALKKARGRDVTLHIPSPYDIVQAGVDVLRDEIHKRRGQVQ